MLGEIDLLIRGGVIGISALTFTLLWLNPASRRKSYSVGAIAIALAGHLAKRKGAMEHGQSGRAKLRGSLAISCLWTSDGVFDHAQPAPVSVTKNLLVEAPKPETSEIDDNDLITPVRVTGLKGPGPRTISRQSAPEERISRCLNSSRHHLASGQSRFPVHQGSQ